MTIRPIRAAVLAAALLTAACAPAAAPATRPDAVQPAADAAGTYEFTGDMRGQSFQGVIRLARADSGGYTGTLTTTLAGEMPVRSAEMQGRRLRVTAEGRMGEAVLTLDVDGQSFAGSWSYGPSSGTLSGRVRAAS
jgi:hypothetical protein